MKVHLAGSILALVLGAVSGRTQPCAGECPCVPTTTLAPVLLYHRPEPVHPDWGPTVPLPPPTLFRGEMTAPIWGQAPPAPAIQLFHATPPAVTLINAVPPAVELFRHESAPPVWTHVPPPPSVTLFRRD